MTITPMYPEPSNVLAFLGSHGLTDQSYHGTGTAKQDSPLSARAQPSPSRLSCSSFRILSPKPWPPFQVCSGSHADPSIWPLCPPHHLALPCLPPPSPSLRARDCFLLCTPAKTGLPLARGFSRLLPWSNVGVVRVANPGSTGLPWGQAKWQGPKGSHLCSSV